jgi:hypothetical protein
MSRKLTYIVEIQRNTIAELFKFSSHAYSILNEFTTRVVQLEDGVETRSSQNDSNITSRIAQLGVHRCSA